MVRRARGPGWNPARDGAQPRARSRQGAARELLGPGSQAPGREQEAGGEGGGCAGAGDRLGTSVAALSPTLRPAGSGGGGVFARPTQGGGVVTDSWVASGPTSRPTT